MTSGALSCSASFRKSNFRLKCQSLKWHRNTQLICIVMASAINLMHWVGCDLQRWANAAWFSGACTQPVSYLDLPFIRNYQIDFVRIKIANLPIESKRTNNYAKPIIIDTQFILCGYVLLNIIYWIYCASKSCRSILMWVLCARFSPQMSGSSIWSGGPERNCQLSYNI